MLVFSGQVFGYIVPLSDTYQARCRIELLFMEKNKVLSILSWQIIKCHALYWYVAVSFYFYLLSLNFSNKLSHTDWQSQFTEMNMCHCLEKWWQSYRPYIRRRSCMEFYRSVYVLAVVCQSTLKSSGDQVWTLAFFPKCIYLCWHFNGKHAIHIQCY